MAVLCGSLMAPVDQHPAISDIMHRASLNRTFPGGAVGFGSCTVPCYYGAYGTFTYESTIPVTPQSVWDMGSLTKVMITTPCIMLLYERGLLELDTLACQYVPEFGNNGKEVVTVRQLLTHTAGLREFYFFFDMALTTREQVLQYVMNDKLWYSVGTARYSDLSMIVLGIVVERITGASLDEFAENEFVKPLGLRHTYFRPPDRSEFDPTIVPTEVDLMHRNRLLWGEVHDPTAFLLGGVAGHAGLFSSIVDVCRFAQLMLAGGIDLPTNRRFFKEQTVKLFTTPSPTTPLNLRPFALGWDVAVRRSLDGYTSAGQFLGPRTFGHTGFTGTSLWIDPDQNIFVALLTNAVHPSAMSGSGHKLREVRPLIADAAVQAMREQAIPREPLIWHRGTVAAQHHLSSDLGPKCRKARDQANVVFVSHLSQLPTHSGIRPTKQGLNEQAVSCKTKSRVAPELQAQAGLRGQGCVSPRISVSVSQNLVASVVANDLEWKIMMPLLVLTYLVCR